MAIAAQHERIRSGYKQTEVGDIPEDWEVIGLSSLTAFPTQNGVFNEPGRKGRGCKLINVIDLYSAVPIDTSSLERFDATKAEIARFGVAHGDLFFTRSSLTPDGIAHCNIYSQLQNEDIVFDCHIIRVRANTSKIDPFFLVRYCSTAPARKYLVANAKTTTMTTVDQGVIANLPVPQPPLPEQRAIAGALSHVDALIASLDELIAKKRDIKTAAMQQLLTGKRRLPGFSGEWDVRLIGSFSAFVTKGATPTTYGFNWQDDGVLFLRSECVSDDGLDLAQSMFVSEAAHAALIRGEVRSGDILMTITGNVGRVVHLKPEFGFANINQHIARIRVKDPGVLADFVYHWLSQPSVRAYYTSITTGQAYPQISLKQVRETRIPLPNLREQTAIAIVLSDMDAEIAALEQRRDKTRDIKQAMMQELLTGKTRLI